MGKVDLSKKEVELKNSSSWDPVTMVEVVDDWSPTDHA